MTCADRRDDLLLYVIDGLDEAERRELISHLDSGCPECAGALAEARAVLSHVGLAAKPVVPPAAVKERLLKSVAAREDGTARFPVERARRPAGAGRGIARTIAAAGVAAAVTAALILGPAWRERSRLEGELALQASRIRELESGAESAAAMIRLLSSPRVEVVSLEGQGTQPDAAARIFWDKSRGTWQLFASNLKSPGPGKTYELWFITADQRKVRAGTFDVDAAGDGALVAQIPPGLGPLALAAVTDEPAGGVDVPTGSIHLLGKLQPAASS
jgi:anti-sigma factor RsiW